MSLETKRIKELFGYARTLTKEQGVGVMAGRAVGFFKRRFFGKKARYLPSARTLDAQRAKCRRLADHQHPDPAVQHAAAVFAAASGQRAGPDGAQLAACAGRCQR